jgi:DNA-binding NarL/FixJ family response regulator
VLSFPSEPPPLPPELSPAERDVMALVLDGVSNAEIARRRGRSVRTIANQIAACYKKLGVSSRLELAARLGRR